MNEFPMNPGGEMYEIKLKGHLDESWLEWFEGLVLTHQSDGSTTLRGVIVDQSALHGMLKKIRDLGMPLLSVKHIKEDQI
jgi:hypothetical protein